jgi:hypothetical protein
MNRWARVVSVVLLVGLTVGAGAQAASTSSAEPVDGNSLDEVFQNLESDVVVTGAEPSPVPQGPSRPMFLYFGTLETQGLFASGWTDDARTSVASSLYYYLHLQGGIDVKPIPEARLIGTFSTYLPQDLDSSIITSLKSGNTQSNVPGNTASSVNTSSSLSLDELYLDYDLLKAATFRIGKFGTTWGQGRIFNPGNLVSDTSGSVNLRGFIPVGPVNVTGVVVGNASFFAVKTKPKAEELGYAGSLDWNLGAIAIGLSSYHQLVKGTTVDFSLRGALLGFDLYGETLGMTRYGDHWRPGLLVGVDRSFDLGAQVKVVGEYWLDTDVNDVQSRSVGLGISVGGFGPGDLRLNSKWIHSVTDQSGQLVFGFAATPFPKLDVTLGVPWTYGPANGVYVTGNTDPEKRLLAAMLSVNVTLNFEKEH